MLERILNILFIVLVSAFCFLWDELWKSKHNS